MAKEKHSVVYSIGPYHQIIKTGDIAVIGSSMGWVSFVRGALDRIDVAANPIVDQNNRYFHVQSTTSAKGHKWIEVICVGQYWPEEYEEFRQIAINNMNTGVYLFSPLRPANISSDTPYSDRFRNERVFAGDFQDEWKDIAVQTGLYDAIWRPNTFGPLCAKTVIAPLTVGLSVLEDKYGRNHPMALLVREYRDKCKDFPDALVRLGAVDQQTQDHTKKITGVRYY